MEILRRLLAAIWKIWFMLWFVIIALASIPFFSVLLLHRKWLRLVLGLQRIVSFLILFFGGIILKKIYIINKKNLPHPCVYVANHSSYLDIMTSYLVIPGMFIFMAKAELKKAPFIRMFFKDFNVLVNRKSKKDSHRAYVQVGERIDEGFSVYIFPEGTISDEGKLKLFKNGAFKLAIDKQVPVVPIVYTNNWRLLQNGGFFKSHGRPGLTKAIVLAPIPTKGMTEENLVTLREDVHRLFSETLNKYN